MEQRAWSPRRRISASPIDWPVPASAFAATSCCRKRNSSSRELESYVNERAAQQAIAREQVRFTQRQLRETLHWSDRALRRQLARLVQLEYVLAHRSGRGNQRAYQLLYSGQTVDGAPLLLGLTDVEHLCQDPPR